MASFVNMSPLAPPQPCLRLFPHPFAWLFCRWSLRLGGSPNPTPLLEFGEAQILPFLPLSSWLLPLLLPVMVPLPSYPPPPTPSFFMCLIFLNPRLVTREEDLKHVLLSSTILAALSLSRSFQLGYKLKLWPKEGWRKGCGS